MASPTNQITYDNKPSIDEEDGGVEYAGALVSSFIFPMVFNACIELDVLEIINKAGRGAQLSSHAIAAQLPIRNNNPDHAPAVLLDRMLYLLASYNILTCSVESLEDCGGVQRRYGLTSAGSCFLRSEERGSMAPFSLLTRHQAIMDMRFHLKDAVLEGGFPFEKAHGMSIYKYNDKDPIFGEAFNFAMSQYSILVVKQILKKYMGFEGLSTFVDVGGGIGGTLNLIISKYPSIKGINFDVPEVLRNAPPLNGIEHVRGDMFKEVPKGDAILLKLILHNWNDDQCLKILKNCYKALPETGKVIIIDPVLPVAPEATNFCKFATQSDNIVFNMLGAGKERTEPEFRSLATAAGFKDFRVACCVCAYLVMELHK
ncbi:caffeic acid 3-O-methyltransferase-like [Juglans microcarpa x Juglans regia]|uniref:caffeic acid 3-O-methyltransferase-like n=1 Tax=Juglans microcarpa x Juglans regia TaxID=2249226 RepID=UPI001B7EC76D|nr:caffeic acid 3-O-methyltransferase-like [Juglans microcarpa x Juglans regia]